MFFSRKAKAFCITMLMVFIFSGTIANAASYTVVQGDSLYKIGKLYNTTSSEIVKANNLTNDLIYPGQKLIIPSAEYTVKSGDTLYLIAKRHDVTLDSLRIANNKWDDYIYPGQVLKLPHGNAGKNRPIQNATNKSVVQYTPYELDLLARLITAEADSEPYNAKVAVGGVVVNRVKDSRFPDTIKDVIYEKSYGYYQFTPVENGWINKPASQSSVQAAKEALDGSDPSNGALFYFDDSSTNKWLWSKPIKAWIGKMVYVY
ncbi:MAG: LysM peptidoglycan-binding domain-containing protein [Clostridiaceae bacterium]|jgi:N-acetylmuramoyl-L-alanine amidase|nr:LysM peptidoglycan-binding domain-containing protein [Clostridiaceae bacterium]